MKYDRKPSNIILLVVLENLRPMIAIAVIGLLFTAVSKEVVSLSNITARLMGVTSALAIVLIS